MTKKVVIVTGASSGIGKAAVVAFLKQGFIVHATARRMNEMKELEVRGAILHHLDLKKPADISAFVKAVLAQSSRIDVLVNNAGYGSYGAVEEVPMEEARAQIEVNVFAPALLIQEVLPTMRKQRSGKIINISSIGGKVWTPLGAWYHTSKFALEGLSDVLRNEVRPFGIDVVVVEPGGVKTEWTAIAMESMMKISGQGPYRKIGEALYELSTSSSADQISTTPEVIADVILKAANAAKPKARYVAPFSGRAMLFVRWLFSDHTVDWIWGKIFKLPKTL